MKATKETREEFEGLLDKRTTLHIGYVELENFLSKIFGFRIRMVGSSNDTVHEANVTSLPDEDDVKEIEMMIKRDRTFEYWRVHQVFGWLVYNGYIDMGDYFVNVWW